METTKKQAKKSFAVLLLILVLSLAYDSYGDAVAPKPNPLWWAIVPAATGPYTIRMRAVDACDVNDMPVQYLFTCTNDGTKSSAWQSSPTYEVPGLTPKTSYTFNIKAKDNVGNIGTATFNLSATTDDNSTPPVLRLDLNNTADNNDANTQTAFLPFVIANSGTEINGVTIDLSGTIASTRRDDPYGAWEKYDAGGSVPGDPCYYSPRAGERIYRDFIYGISPSGVTITLWGLGANQDCNITIWAYDACSTGSANRVANWYANGTYIFDTNFIGGSAGWPCYDNQNFSPASSADLYKYAFKGRATADNFGRIVLTSTRGANSPANEPFAFVNALKVEPNKAITFVPTKYACRPQPLNGSENVPVDALLKWRNGAGVVKHDLYLGTNFNDVNTATRASHHNVLVYAPDLATDANTGTSPRGAGKFLALDTTYYWRVDENDPGPVIYKGEIWSFTTLPYFVVDNFDEYPPLGNDGLKAVWKDFYTQDPPVTSAEVWLANDPNRGGSPYPSMGAATQAEINGAIEKGVAWLAAQQILPAGYWHGDSADGDFPAAGTGLALVKLQERAFELGYTSPFDPCYSYEQNVEKGLAYLFSQMSIISISTQPAGNPDTDGDGNGVCVHSSTYETGIAMMAIAASRAPNKVVNSSGSPVNGWTYKHVLVDMVDYMAFGQCDSDNGRGGWTYSDVNDGYGGADNSNSGYAVLGLGYAASPRYDFNCVIPQFVKDELKIWIDYIQTNGGDDDGGSGYSDPSDRVNILKTGNLIFQMTFVGISLEDPNMQRALAYIERKWDDSSQDPGWGNPAYGGYPNCQAMFCVMKGLDYVGIDTIVVDGSPRDWYADFADALVNAQQTDGSWPPSSYGYGGDVLATEWALTTLERLAPPPPMLELTKIDDVNSGDCRGPGDDVNYTICYSYHGDVNCPNINDVNLIDELPEDVRFISADSNGTYDRCSNTVTWNLGTLSPGESGCVTLKVKVKCAGCAGTRNTCEIKSGEQILTSTHEDTPVCYASDPSPSCGTDVSKDVVLCWMPGPKADKHDVYFGADRSKVASANRSNPLGVLVSQDQDPCTYDPCGLLERNQCYYWRIDEVNDANIWRGGVWHFRTGADDANLVSGGEASWSMKYQFENFTYSPYYSEARASVDTARPNGLGMDPNWKGMNAKSLSLWFYGQAGNDANKPMYIKLVDGDAAQHTAQVNYDGDMNDIRQESWHEWDIDLQEFVDNNSVNLANVKTITIGFGDGTQAASDGTVYFEDIRLYNRRCRPDLFAGDLDGDCVVNFRDFAILANEWLDTGCCDADLYKDNKVDFKDLAIMMDNWLEEG